MDKALKAVLEWWEVSGVDIPAVAPARRSAPSAPKAKPEQHSAPEPAPAITSETLSDIKSLEELRKAIASFDAGEISDHARQAVISRGNPEADIMVIGEAPGRDEDIQGKPFVGRSGQLLDKIFASIGLNEDTLYITNVVYWRPPGNRNPTPEELVKCLPFTQKQIELIDPKIIILVGGVSFNALTGKSGIMKNRGQWISLSANDREIPTLPVYHPAFLLRQPALKKDAWRDMLSLREKIEALNAAS